MYIKDNATLQEKIDSIQYRIKQNELEIKERKVEISKLNGRVQPTVKELYNGIDKYITIMVENKEYDHVLGGDGRSSPYSEKRTDDVATVTIGALYWFNSDQKKIIREYVKSITNGMMVEFIYD